MYPQNAAALATKHPLPPIRVFSVNPRRMIFHKQADGHPVVVEQPIPHRNRHKSAAKRLRPMPDQDPVPRTIPDAHAHGCTSG